MSVLPNTIYTREAFFAYVTFSYQLTADLRAIRATHRGYFGRCLQCRLANNEDNLPGANHEEARGTVGNVRSATSPPVKFIDWFCPSSCDDVEAQRNLRWPPLSVNWV